ncbi:hypothetical protein [Kallotenue papyrolyticum]|uniref:hypothetical protein n=1 Tax=Kallotenue papyrolyticum TaxID=1325125 RepID=UPI00047866E1|nr:hypothetical protein [Kallotenue papyrolyticum]
MATLHIEHPISDLQTWLTAFGRFAEARQQGGVRAHRIYQPVGDDKYILIDLDFDTVDEAERFKRFLELNVWSSREASPGLAGTPQARVLERVAPET